MKPLPRWIALVSVIIAMYACASMGTPDGGPEDYDPPKFVRSTPEPNAINYNKKKVTIEFDEFIKLEKASEKVIISPPQAEAPEVRASGKKVIVQFQDSIKQDITYTIDFGDAIVDNNANNPLGQFAFAFSTGNTVDTMAVSGTVLNAENLEPIKGIQVGLHKNLNDSAFVKLPFDRISRTDSRGRFTIRGVAPGKYRIYALMDGNQNFFFDSKTEQIAWSDSLIVPSMEPAVRQDTVWNPLDTAKIDTIKTVNYTRFLPDNIMLRAFKEENDFQYLQKSERPKTNQFSIYFSAKNKELPAVKGLDFDEQKLIVEANSRKDSLLYWITDTVLCERDTLTLQLDYWATDTLKQLVPKTDTIRFVNKIPRERRLAMREEEMKKKEKERKKRARKGDTLSVETKFLSINVDAPSSLDLNRNITVSFDEPITSIDTAAIHMTHKVDTVWQDIPFLFVTDTVAPRRYEILADWKPGDEYRLNIDSLAFQGVYGLRTDKVE